MATTQMMEKITEDNKALKVKFQEEFDQFQQFFKDQNSTLQTFKSKVRQMEAAVKNVGDTATLNKMMDDYRLENFVRKEQLEQMRMMPAPRHGRTSSTMSPTGDPMSPKNKANTMKKEEKLLSSDYNLDGLADLEDRIDALHEILEN